MSFHTTSTPPVTKAKHYVLYLCHNSGLLYSLYEGPPLSAIRHCSLESESWTDNSTMSDGTASVFRPDHSFTTEKLTQMSKDVKRFLGDEGGNLTSLHILSLAVALLIAIKIQGYTPL